MTKLYIYIINITSHFYVGTLIMKRILNNEEHEFISLKQQKRVGFSSSLENKKRNDFLHKIIKKLLRANRI